MHRGSKLLGHDAIERRKHGADAAPTLQSGLAPELTQEIHRGNSIARRQPHDLVPLAEQKWIGCDYQNVRFLPDEVREGCIDFTFSAGEQDLEPRASTH